jgi:hypothetical protein
MRLSSRVGPSKTLFLSFSSRNSRPVMLPVVDDVQLNARLRV